MNSSSIIVTLIIIVLGTAFIIGLISVFHHREPSELQRMYSSSEGEREDAVCLTAGCVQAASTITKKMNPAVDPCDDFYEFACGGFLNSTTIADDEIIVHVWSMMAAKNRERLRSRLEEPSLPDEPRPFRLAKDLYQACINETAIEKAGLEPLHEVLEKLGKWPVVEGNDWKEEDFDWIESVRMFRELGYPVDHFLKFEIRVDTKNGTKNVITLGPATLTLSKMSRRTYVEVERYLEYMVNIAVFLGADKQRAIEELRESLKFEKSLADVPLSSLDIRNLLYSPTTVAELERRYPSINWKKYINNLLPEVDSVANGQVVIVQSLGFIDALEELLKKTPKRVLANYSVWKAIEASVEYLSKSIQEIRLNYAMMNVGQIKGSARWETCVQTVSKKLSIGTSALYVRKFSREDTKKAVVKIVANIKKQLSESLNKADWMDSETTSDALEKVAAMTDHISHSEELFDDKKLEEYYADLKLSITSDNFFSAILNLTRFQTDKSFGGLRKPVNRHVWSDFENSADIGARYNRLKNEIDIPAGSLQDAFVTNEHPQYMNYGAIGYVIGHEITHAFDNVGMRFDKNGNVVEWRTKITASRHTARMMCIRHQYSNYRVKSLGLRVDGTMTLDENVADNGGIKLAHMAYNEWVKSNSREPKLPGLKYTPEQLFWISAANIWCTKVRPEVVKISIRKDPHSPARFRVNGPFSNMPEFAADFNCPVGSNLNPEQSCYVW